MLETIGQRIRQLRKQQKLTLEALAGKELSKGMLSLIENGKAQPSIESLTYIAKRLGVKNSELMEELNQTKRTLLLEKVEKLAGIDLLHQTNEYEQIIAKVEPIADQLTLSYESARLLDLYCRAIFYVNNEGWEDSYTRARNMYDQLYLYNKSASIALFRGMIHFTNHHYEDSLAIILEEHELIQIQSIQLDAMTKLDYLYNEAILFSAVGNFDKAHLKTMEALNFSKDQRIFYRIDDLYRLACFQAIIHQDEELRHYYLRKIRQYGVFAEHPKTLAIAELLEAHYFNSFKHGYQKAIEHIEQFLVLSKKSDIGTPNLDDMNHYSLEKGKALFGLGEFSEALALLEVYKVPANFHHPYDLSMAYEVFAYRALCYDSIGKLDMALIEAQKGVELVSPLPDSPYKTFIQQTLLKIQKKR